MTEDTLPKMLRRNAERYGDGKVAMRKKEFGIFTDCTPPEVKHIFIHSGASFAVARDQEQVDKFLALREEFPALRQIIYWDPSGLWSYDDPLLLSFEKVTEMGREYDRDHPGAFEQRVDKGKAEDVAFLAYAHHWFQLVPFGDRDEYFPIIAPAWLPEQWHGLAICLSAGMAVSFAEAAGTIQMDSREIAPQFTDSPPRGWENMARRIQALMIDSELPRTKKLRRTFTEARYGSLIEALYADYPEVEMEAEVKYRDGRVGKVGTRLKVVSLP